LIYKSVRTFSKVIGHANLTISVPPVLMSQLFKDSPGSLMEKYEQACLGKKISKDNIREDITKIPDETIIETVQRLKHKNFQAYKCKITNLFNL
jgi:hypothetical protein